MPLFRDMLGFYIRLGKGSCFCHLRFNAESVQHRISSTQSNWESFQKDNSVGGVHLLARILKQDIVFKTNRIYSTVWHPTPVLLPGKSHGWRSLVSCSPWRCSESDTTERFHFHFSLSCIGEGNGNHSSTLAQRIPGMGEPGGLLSMRSHRVGHNWSDLAVAAAGLSKLPLWYL